MKKIITIILILLHMLNYSEPPQFIKDGLKAFEQITGDPNSISNLFYRANILIRFQEFDHALELLNKIINAYPNATNALYNKAYVLKISGKPAESIPYYKKVIESDNNYQGAKLGLSHACLATGNYEEGFALFEHRLSNENSRNYSKLDLNNISGKKIIIATEAYGGLGDWMMMIRFAKVLKDHGAHIIAQAPEVLKSLFSLCTYIDSFVPQKRAFPPHDKTILLMNLALSCNVTLKTIPNDPYLYADEQLVTFWKNKIAHDTNFKIALFWGELPQSALIQTSPHGKRSMPLEKLVKIGKIPGVSLYSLQKCDGMEELTGLSKEIKIITFDSDFDESHGRFMDTAALMKNMDLIVTLDTAPAHLAGALGVPTWVYLPVAPEWRWMVDRTDSPWYPTMRLFRQHNPGNWDDVVQDMIDALPELIHQKGKYTGNNSINKPHPCNTNLHRALANKIVENL